MSNESFPSVMPHSGSTYSSSDVLLPFLACWDDQHDYFSGVPKIQEFDVDTVDRLIVLNQSARFVAGIHSNHES